MRPAEVGINPPMPLWINSSSISRVRCAVESTDLLMKLCATMRRSEVISPGVKSPALGMRSSVSSLGCVKLYAHCSELRELSLPKLQTQIVYACRKHHMY